MKFLAIEASRLDLEPRRPILSQEETALIPVCGFLTHHPVDDFWEPDRTSYDEIREAFTAALDDPDVTRIAFDIDSPGGEVNGLFDLCDLIFEARGVKPIEAFANDNAFSAAYALASSAGKVWCSRTSGVGSIGVIATHVDLSGYDKKEGFKMTELFEGAHKNDLSPHAPLTEEARFETQKEIKRLYELFVRTVARNRKLPIDVVKATEAALFFGENAFEAGLADGFRTLPEVLIPRSLPADVLNPQPRSLMMNEEQPKIPTEPIVEPALEEKPPLEPPLPNPPEPPVPEPLDVNGLIKLSKVAKCPERLANWLENKLTVAQAQEEILKEMENQPVIASSHASLKAPENPLIQAAQRRLQ